MASKFALDAIRHEKTVPFEHGGITFHMSASPNMKAWNRLRTEQMTAAGEDVDLMSKAPEDGGATAEQAARWLGRSMAGPIVKGIDSFQIGDETFKFDAPSEMDYYETQGEELLGENPIMQDAVFRKAVEMAREPPDYEVNALGKSSAPSDSGVVQIATG